MPDGMPVKTGYDYHLAEVGRHTRGAPPVRYFEAYCDACGWVGPERTTRGAAEDDAAAHDVASNPASNR